MCKDISCFGIHFWKSENFYYLVFLSARDERVFYNTKK